MIHPWWSPSSSDLDHLEMIRCHFDRGMRDHAFFLQMLPTERCFASQDKSLLGITCLYKDISHESFGTCFRIGSPNFHADIACSGCQLGFGSCGISSSGSPAVTTTSVAAKPISTDGSCSTNGRTCLGSSSGNCCSASNYCGNSADYCGTGRCRGVCHFFAVATFASCPTGNKSTAEIPRLSK